MKIGTIVKMSEEFKKIMIGNGCTDHVEEFGDCEGVVEGPMEEGWPEFNVRWMPSKLRYGYHPDDLVVVGEKKHRSIDDSDENPTRIDSPLTRSRIFLRGRVKIRNERH